MELYKSRRLETSMKPVLMSKKRIKEICIMLSWGIILTSCGPSNGSKINTQPDSLKLVDKQTLITMVEQLHKSLNGKDYSVEKGMHVLKPYLSKYKICIPGFSAIVPYNKSYLYVFCLYDTKESPPRILSFRFALPHQLAQQLTENEIRKPFKTWQVEDTNRSADSTTIVTYNTGDKDLSVRLMKQALPNYRDSMITEIIIFH